jgi:sugar lactone lactonase YvrE
MDFVAIAEGFHLEGLCADGDTIWFTDAFASGVQRRAPDGRIDIWLADKPMVPAVLLNADGKVLISGHPGLTWLDPETGESGVLADEIGGEPMLGINEMIPDRRGGLYFGVLDHVAVQEHRAPASGGLFHLDLDGQVQVINAQVGFPNGIGLSEDGRHLYCNQTFSGLTAYDIDDDGMAGPPRLLFEMNDCDGLAIDENGDLWVSGFSTSDLLRFSPEGELLERVPTPAPGISNVRFGGADGRQLLITATCPETITEFSGGGPVKTRGSKPYRAASNVAGLPIPKTQYQIS